MYFSKLCNMSDLKTCKNTQRAKCFCRISVKRETCTQEYGHITDVDRDIYTETGGINKDFLYMSKILFLDGDT